MLEFVTLGDLHLDKMYKLYGDKTLELQIKEAEKVFKYAKKKGIKHLIQLGDVAHNPRLTYEAQIALQRLLDKYDGHINIYIILGNHDLEMTDVHSCEPLHEMVRSNKYKSVWFFDKPKQMILDGVPVNFLPFPYKEPLDDKEAINCAHLERPGAIRDNGSKIVTGGDPDNKSGKWILGHLHTPQVVGNSLYTGTVYQTNFGESLPKSFLHVRAEYNKKKNKLKTRHKVIEVDPAFKLFNLKVNSLQDFDTIEDNELYLYKVFIQEDVQVPDNLLSKYPNIVNRINYSSETEFEDLLMNSSPDDIKHDIKEGLDERLKGILTKKQIKRAHQMIDRFLGETK